MKNFNILAVFCLVLLATGATAKSTCPSSAEDHLRRQRVKKPVIKVTPFTASVDVKQGVPIIILVNKTHLEIAHTEVEVYVDDKLGLMTHGANSLKNGEQRIVIPFIRAKGEVQRLFYRLSNGTRVVGHVQQPLRSDTPMIITLFPRGIIKINKPYKQPL